MIDTLSNIETSLIKRYISLLTTEIDIDSIYLFGSRARIEGDLGSDVDIAIVIDDDAPVKEITHKAIELSIQAEEDMDIMGEMMINPVVITRSLLKARLGIGRTIREEGILLWSGRSTKER